MLAPPKSPKRFSSKQHATHYFPAPTPNYEPNYNLLYRYISIEEIPVQYGGLKREKDAEFSIEDGGVSELVTKSGSTATIEIPAPEVRTKKFDPSKIHII